MEDQDRHGREALVREHYDEPPELFACFLDTAMNYSTAFFPDPATTLDEAQQIKLRKYADWLAAKPGGHYLDVGCGWGALCLHLAAHHNAQVVGLTLSPNQAQYGSERAREEALSDRVALHVKPFLEYPEVEAGYDGISFIGSIVHMRERSEVMRRAARGLRPGGRLVISETYLPDRKRTGLDSRSSHFILEGIFGFSHPTTLSDEIAAIENAGLRVLQVEHSTEHYVRTLQEWIARLRVARDRVEAIQPGSYRRLRTYLGLGHSSFRAGTMLQYEIVAERSDAATKPWTAR
ncbi:MAG: class I SAM-dependent methyltransferase [Thermaerobacter sp.]|nr:class I SAM-dependent methyltransferase [Thermaerobacter sp.]